MFSWRTFRVVLLVAMLFSLVKAVVTHAPHLGPLEWVVSVLLVLVLVAAIIPVPRRA